MMMGVEDASIMQNYSKSLKCRSQKGVLLVMSVQDFQQRVKTNEETWKIIKSRAISKFAYDEKVTRMSKNMKYKPRKMKRNTHVAEHDVIKPNDFANISFGGTAIPSTKVDRVIFRLRKPANAPSQK